MSWSPCNVCYQGSNASLVGSSERRLDLAPLPCHQGKGVTRRTRGSGHGALSNVQGDQLTTATNPACPYPRCACPWLVHHIVRLRSMHTCLLASPRKPCSRQTAWCWPTAPALYPATVTRHFPGRPSGRSAYSHTTQVSPVTPSLNHDRCFRAPRPHDRRCAAPTWVAKPARSAWFLALASVQRRQ